MHKIAIIERIKRCMIEGRELNDYKCCEYITLKCNKCPHQFSCRKNYLLKGVWCPYCCVKNRKLCNDMTCQYCLDNSIQGLYPELIDLSHRGLIWSEKNAYPPRYFSRFSNKIAILLCTVCNHETKRRMYSNLINCNYCSHTTYLCEKKECKWCWDKSFAHSPLSKYMIDNAWTYPKRSSKYCRFRCESCDYIFQKSPHSIRGSIGCPSCHHLMK